VKRESRSSLSSLRERGGRGNDRKEGVNLLQPGKRRKKRHFSPLFLGGGKERNEGIRLQRFRRVTGNILPSIFWGEGGKGNGNVIT